MSTQHPRAPSSALPLGVTVLALVSLAAWVIAAVLMSGRGLDLTDESFYLLSYRWWDSTPRAFSGVQYLYGPLFELIGYDVASLRVTRMLTILGSHAVFAWAFVTWMTGVRPGVVARRWGFAAAALIVASGGIVYGWLPQSPGYNDVALLGSLLLFAVVLRSAHGVASTGRLPWAPAVGVGPIVLALLLAKWASAVLIVVVLGAVLAASIGVRHRGWSRYFMVSGASLATAAWMFHLVVLPWGDVLPPLLEVNRIVAAGGNSPSELAGWYFARGVRLLAWAVIVGLPAMVFMVFAKRLRVHKPRLGLALATAAPFLVVVALAPSWLGAARVDYTPALIVPAALVLATHLLLERDQDGRHGGPPLVRTGPVMAGLIVLPVVQATGTGNPVNFLAVNQYAAWMAVLVWYATTSTARLVQAVSWGTVVTSLLVVATVAVAGLVVHPYRTSGFSDATERIGGSSVVADLLVSPEEARMLDATRDAAGQRQAGSHVMAFDEMAGFVLAMDGRSVGEAWYSGSDHARTEAGIKAACGSSPLLPAPVLLFNRSIESHDIGALRQCGYGLADFRRVDVSSRPHLTLYVPHEGEVPR